MITQIIVIEITRINYNSDVKKTKHGGEGYGIVIDERGGGTYPQES